MEQPTAPNPPGAAISARELSKRYGRRQAVSGLTFTVESGQICALLGPNGAGKTSTMRMLVGLSRADSGSARLLGEPSRLAAGVLARVGVAIDGPAFVPHLSGRRNLELAWRAGGRTWPPPALEESLRLAGLGEALDAKKVKSYSMGMRQRLMLAQALMGGPDRSGSSDLSAASAAWAVLGAAGYVTVCLLSIGSIALALGLLLPRSVEALGITVAFLIGSAVLENVSAVHDIIVLLPVHYWMRWTQLFGGDAGQLIPGLVAQVAAVAVALAAGYLLLARRDPAA